MYFGGISKALLIRDNVSVITNMKYSHLIGNWLQLEVKLFVKMIHEMSGPT